MYRDQLTQSNERADVGVGRGTTDISPDDLMQSIRAAHRQPVTMACLVVMSQMAVGLLADEAPAVMNFRLISLLNVGMLMTLVQLGVTVMVIAWYGAYSDGVIDPLVSRYRRWLAMYQAASWRRGDA